jgi:ABC-type bacteriocin/lantibiotic exporter with double-glycine peptidase domain
MTQKSLDADTLNYLKRILDRFLFIKLNRLAYIEKENYLNGINKNIVATNKLTMFQTVVSIISSYIGNLSQMSILIAGAFFIHNETLTLGVFISFTNLIQKLNEPINYLNSIPFMWKDLLSSYSRVIPLLTNESFNIERIEEIKQPNIIIQCRNVSLSYENRKILKDFNYSIKEKQNMAIIGKSGIGKSSFCKMLAGILEYDGEIIINKNKDNNVPLFGFIIDQCSLFDGTLGENLLYGKENNNITFEEISEILKYLEIDYFTAGLETNLWVNKLSHGEKQRLEIARILIQKPQIIILDEATSGMDNMTENKVWNLIRDRCKNSTIIYITHNLSIIREEDIVLDFNSLPDVIINEGNTDKILTNVV